MEVKQIPTFVRKHKGKSFLPSMHSSQNPGVGRGQGWFAVPAIATNKQQQDPQLKCGNFTINYTHASMTCNWGGDEEGIN